MSRSIRDDIDKLMDYDIYLPTRTLYLGSVGDEENGVDYNLVQRVTKGLHILDNATSDKPITIIMNCPGGDFIHGQAIFDRIRACKNKVIIHVNGYCMSMASIILQAADERVLDPNSKMMLHYGETDFEGHTKNAQKWMEEEKKLQKWMEGIYLDKIRKKHPRFKLKRLQEMLNFDTYITAEQAVELGLADRVAEPYEGDVQ